MDVWRLLASGWLVAAVAMALLWLAVGRRNGGVVDVAMYHVIHARDGYPADGGTRAHQSR